MPDRELKNHPHFTFQNSAQAESFVSPSTGGRGKQIPDRDRNAHGGALLGKIQRLAPVLAETAEQQRQAGIEEGIGLQIEFESFPDVELAFESLARERSGIEIRNVRQDENKTFATVFVPDGKLDFFEKLIAAYLDMTHLARMTEENAQHYSPIAEVGGLSPFTTTSQTWQPYWPLKPDVVFEGGNVAQDGLGSAWMTSLSLLTTYSIPNERLFTTSNATSAASALCARMAAQLMARYPDLWPESIRGLIVHSAQWTPAMKRMFLPAQGEPTKAQSTQLVRHSGSGSQAWIGLCGVQITR